MTKPHAVCVTFPAQGHVNPMMQLAKLLHSKGFFITFINTEFNHNRLIRAKGSSEWARGFPDFQFETMPDGLPPSDRDATQDPPALGYALQQSTLPALRKVLERLRLAKGVPPVTCIVADGVMSGAIRAAQEIGVPAVQFWTASACGFAGYLQYPELIRRGIVPFKDDKYEVDGTLDTAVDWIPGVNNIRLRDLPSLMRITSSDDILFNFLKDQLQDGLQASAIIFNTFDSLEHQVLASIEPVFRKPIYTIGQIASLVNQLVPSGPLKSFRPSLWKDDTECLQWLAQWGPNSVVYVNYGCVTVMSQDNLVEFAWGLANSNRPFLWVVRPDVVMGESGSLPQGFIDETRSRGLVVTWCPQEEVVSHPSVGVFVTHCGWNSMLEGVCLGGVPLICWPFFAEQQTNCRYACCEEEWGVGLELSKEVRREEVERMIREVMDTEKGEKMRRRALEWKEKAEKATRFGGSSFVNFEKFVKELLETYSSI